MFPASCPRIPWEFFSANPARKEAFNRSPTFISFMAGRVRGQVSPAPLLLFVAILLLGALAFAIANLTDATPLPPFVPDRGGAPFGPFGVQVDPVWIFAMALIALGAFAAVIVVKFRRFGRLIPASEILLYGIALGVIVLVIFLWPQVTAELDALVEGPGETGSDGGDDPGGTTGARFGLGALSTAAGLPLAIAAFAVVAVMIFLLSRQPRRLWRSRTALAIDKVKEEFRREVAEALDRTLLDLEGAGDFRIAILACYQRMLVLLERRGLLDHEALTAREIEMRALANLGLSQGAIDALTSLFEEARYSEHPIGPGERSRAVSHLNAIRGELGA